MARKHGKDRGILQKNGQWYVRLYHDGKEHRFGAFPTKTEAKDHYQKCKREQKVKRFDPETYHKRNQGGVTVGQFIKEYLEQLKAKSLKEQTRYGTWWVKLLSKQKLREIDRPTLERIQARLIQKYEASSEETRDRRLVKSPSTVNRYFAFIRHVFYEAIKQDKLDKNPAAGIKMFKESSRLRFLTQGEEVHLREKIGEQDWPLVEFALHTGMRQSEQFSLRWTEVDLENRIITLTKTKSGKVRYIPINDNILNILKRLDSWLTPWVFTDMKNPSKPRSGQSFYINVFMPAVRELGLDSVCWHTLRHTFASRLVMAGIDLRTVQELMGHYSITMTMRYAHLSPQHLRKAVDVLSSFGTVTKTGTKESYQQSERKSESFEGIENIGEKGWLGDEGSNLDRQIQNLSSCH